MSNRRSFLQRAFGAGAALFAVRGLSAQDMQMPMPMPMPMPSQKPVPQGSHGPSFPTPVVTTDVGDLSYSVDGGAKVFHLVAEVLRQKIHPDKTIDVWGFNGSAPGPTIQVNQGDHVRIIFDNHLPEPSSIHWHGFEDTVGYDGMPGISQEPVKPGGRFVYEFDIHQTGTYFYHSHMAMQEMAGMLGGFIMHPRTPYLPHCDKDFLLHLQEYAVLPSNTVPNTMNMEYNWLLLNGKAGPASTPLIVRQGDRVRLRFVNLGMDHHPMHVHGYTFQVTGTEGGRIPADCLVAGDHRAGRRGPGAGRGVRRGPDRRLDAALPLAPPHDEPDVFQCGQDDAGGRHGPTSRRGYEHRYGHAARHARRPVGR